jgi:glycosyl hydrolase family 71
MGLMAICVAVQWCAAAQIPLKNLPELSLPLTDRKLVIAHCMTNIIRFKGHKFEDSCDPDYYSPSGNITNVFGGLTQVNVLEDPVLKNASLDEAVEFEMRAALRSGIDGFQFYYTLGNTGWDSIISAYLRVATQKKLPFKFTFCISHPAGSTEGAKIQSFAGRINGILAAAGRDNEHWLRTPDGRLVIYMWYGEQLADIPGDGKEPEAYYVARAYKRLADSVKERFACVYSINSAISPEKLSGYLDYFPAVWMWTLPWSEDYPGIRVAQACRERHRTFTGSVFGDFYTSKLLKKGTWDMYYRAEDAVAAGIGQVERKYITTGLSYNFRRLLEFGIGQDVPIMNVITWNDYPEGHHLAPEVNHNDGFAQLLIYYKHLWKKESPLPGGKELAIVFFKKYTHDRVPHPYNIPVLAFQEETIPAIWEDSIEVVTLLRASANLVVNGRSAMVAAGMTVTRVPSQKGVVTVVVRRGGEQETSKDVTGTSKDVTVLGFSSPEGITETPYRSDRLTYALSSDYAAFYKDLFGDRPMVSSCEYGLPVLKKGTGAADSDVSAGSGGHAGEEK